MTAPSLIPLLLLASGLLAAPAARASDPLFGDLTGRSVEQAAPASEGESRRHEARELRRAYWQRERNRLSLEAPAGSPAGPGRALATR
ncbi:hypothetical protein EAH89_04910 [Roseomonas nepalensis]|uniref:Uncharacterized protein n=1 Tax=Muricoccus nepalensis TaxID=1854500 RepID=A0A502GCA7_9PROT|nr:hypothetical protein [Roseomonas nepalensis]TPG59585.1 hypothetical protein EAH89_04910 [Roseomonas nepalensis]